ncbi:O-antigen ligase family protein [Marinospirillum sp. MEB164]|uniref:O-antigen ligase family protein n=1 Tax=Marinospirillum alkalitolerans TaxID=3123374 RepID=A0ABW8Q0M8_9GAMM
MLAALKSQKREQLSFWVLALLLFFLYWSSALTLALNFVLLAFFLVSLLAGKNKLSLADHYPLLLGLVFFSYLLLRVGVDVFWLEQSQQENLRFLRKVWVFLPFFAIALLVLSERSLKFLWVSMSLGFLAYVFFASGEGLAFFTSLERLGVRKLNAQHLGLLAAIFFVVYSFLLAEWMAKKGKSVQDWLLIGMVGLLIGAFLFLTLRSLSRGPWIALLVHFSVLALFYFWQRFRVTGLLVFVVLIATILVSSRFIPPADFVLQRLLQEASVVQTLLVSGLDALEMSSWGIRAHLWAAGLDAGFSHFWFGAGWYAPEGLIAQADIPVWAKDFDHFHNQFIDLFVRLGVFGLLLFLAFLIAVYTAVWRAYLGSYINIYALLMRVSVLNVLVLSFMTETYLSFFSWWQNLALLLGMILMTVMHSTQSESPGCS